MRFSLATTSALIVSALLTISPLAAADNELTPQEKEQGWQLLFNGKDYTGWKCNSGGEVKSAVEEGAMQPFQSGGYVVIHEKPFGDFILKCDVKMDQECNSGIFYRIEDPNDPVNTGFEIQIASGGGTGLHQFGSIYDIVPTTKNVCKGPGEWDSVEIECRGPNMTVRVNGEEVCKLNCDELDQPGKRADGTQHKYQLGGKPRAVKDFARSGYLGFQDHGHKVWYKNVKILELK